MSFFKKLWLTCKLIYYLNKKFVCEATALEFSFLLYLNEVVKVNVVGLSDEDVGEAGGQLEKITNKFSSHQIVQLLGFYPMLGMILLVWNRYGILNPILTSYLINYYCAESKEEAEITAKMYCLTYLEQTINQSLPSKKRFSIDIVPSKGESEVRLRASNEDFALEFSTPRAMPVVISNISERAFGIN